MEKSHKVALVTGANRGIGRAIMLALAEMGTYVVGTAREASGVDAINQCLHESQGSGHGEILDISESDSISDCMAAMQEKVGVPQILVNNAGITQDNLMLRMKADEWHQVLNTNLTGVFKLTQACLRGMMKAKWGRIVNISSVVALTGNAGQVNYAAAKAGLIGMSKSLARELGSRNITVNVIAPGYIETDMTRALDEGQQAKLYEQIPIGRMGRPEDIAHAVAFLTSPMSSYITGETLHVNGGMVMV